MAWWDEYGWTPKEGYQFKQITPGHKEMGEAWNKLNHWGAKNQEGKKAQLAADAKKYGWHLGSAQEALDNEGDLGRVLTEVQKPLNYIPIDVWNMLSPEQQETMKAQMPPEAKPAEGDATPAEPTEPATPEQAPLAWPAPKSQADIEADMGRHSTGGVDWNVGLGNVGGWDLSTQGSFNRGGEDRHGIKDKDDYNVRLNAARAMDWNKMLGAAPLGGPAAKGRYSDYEGGEYTPREMGSRISTSEVARGRKPAPMAAPANPLQPYLDAGISPDQAEMLLANKVPPPRPLAGGGPAMDPTEALKAKLRAKGKTWTPMTEEQKRAQRGQAAPLATDGIAAALGADVLKSLMGFEEGGPVYASQGRYAIQGVPQLQQQKGLMGHALDFGKGQALDYGLEMMFPGGGMAAEAANYIAPRMLKKGGEAKPWYQRAAEYAWGTGRKGENARAAMQGQKPAYRQMGGMTPGPLGMSDMLAAGKGKDVSKVMYKKKGGEVEDTMEISYHAPLAPKGE